MTDEWPTKALRELARVDRGASWSKAQERGDLQTGDRVIRIGNVQPDGLDLADVRVVEGLAARDKERALIDRTTLLMVGSNGNPERIGNVYQSPPEIQGAVLASFLIGIHPRDTDTSRWLYYWLSSPETQSRLTAATAGSTGLKNLSIEWVRALAVPFPPLVVQRRIVDLMEHLDTHLANLETEREALDMLTSAWLDDWQAGHADCEQVLGDLVRFRSGPSWKSSDESPSATAGALRVLKITNTPPGRSIDASDKTYVRSLPDSTRTITDHSLLMIRTNGNRSRIGNVYRPTEEVVGAAVSAFQFLGEFDSLLDRDFVFWYLLSPRLQRQMSESASGTTGLGNLASGWLRTLPIPKAPDQEKQRLISVASTLDEQREYIERERSRLRTFRDQLLSALLTGNLPLSDSYDSLLAVS